MFQLYKHLPNFLLIKDTEDLRPVVKCSVCGTINRVSSHAKNLYPVCAKCKTSLETPTVPPDLTFGREFSYHKYIKNIDVKKLIEVNTVFNEAKGRAFPVNEKCFLCSERLQEGDAVRLSHGSYICEVCFEDVKTIRYPEIYQKRYELFIIEREARRIALEAFTSSLSSTKILDQLSPIVSFINSLMILIITISVGVLLFVGDKLNWFFAESTGFLFIYLLNQIFSNNKNSQTQSILEWGFNNPEPQEPILKHFHDSTAELTQRDKKVLEVFDYWPGYPPFWNYVRNIILNTDKGRCQITGCPNRTELHVHHMLPISQGGSHRIENLVSLCVFHHGLQPDMGHERIWDEIKTQYFTMVRAHYRNGSPVRASVRRKELATENALKDIFTYYSMVCSKCKSNNSLSLRIDYQKNDIFVSCASCCSEWDFEQKLLEESSPLIAGTLRVLQNPGRWHVDISLMETIRKPNYRKLSPAAIAKQSHNKKRFKQNQPLFCPRCGKLLREINGRNGKFLGCTGYPECRHTAKLASTE